MVYTVSGIFPANWVDYMPPNENMLIEFSTVESQENLKQKDIQPERFQPA